VEQNPYRKSTFKKWSKILIENPIDFGSTFSQKVEKGGKRWVKTKTILFSSTNNIIYIL
jgi:hypothetical protein